MLCYMQLVKEGAEISLDGFHSLTTPLRAIPVFPTLYS